MPAIRKHPALPLSAILAAVLAAVLGPPAQAVPIYTARYVLDGVSSGPQTSAVSALAENSKTVVVGAQHIASSYGEVMASASALGLRAMSSSTVYLSGGHMGSNASASFLFDDLVITNEADPGNNAPISVGFRFHLSGDLSLGAVGEPPALPNNSNVQVTVSFGLGNSASLGATAGRICMRTDDSVPCFNTGVFAGLQDAENINTEFITPTRQVHVGVPQYVGLVLQVQSGAANLNVTPQTAAADFRNTLRFATGMPVFDLPDGYTANSVSAGIVNNIYQPVPEPHTYAMLVGGLALLLLRRRRR